MLPDDGGDASLPRGDGVRFPLRFMKNPVTKRIDVYSTRKPYLSANEDFIGAEEDSSYRWKLCTYVRPEFLRVVCDDTTVVRDYGELEIIARVQPSVHDQPRQGQHTATRQRDVPAHVHRNHTKCENF